MTDKTRAMSHWAWGWEDKFPSREGRENLGQMVEYTVKKLVETGG